MPRPRPPDADPATERGPCHVRPADAPWRRDAFAGQLPQHASPAGLAAPSKPFHP
ncbi:hypothetical protein RSPO_m00347 (plasmid) [Ralstonia solanacearum Po82]|uniref:Uncharacterized protein n=1 Tax=Ralstonia solanacearum (strain Po82) TaxID=1031711 RepID=F6G8F7_RALS8|nr:hypothetical protein RSPO_m00347 [Ralstonia solanacearum Po82]